MSFLPSSSTDFRPVVLPPSWSLEPQPKRQEDLCHSVGRMWHVLYHTWVLVGKLQIPTHVQRTLQGLAPAAGCFILILSLAHHALVPGLLTFVLVPRSCLCNGCLCLGFFLRVFTWSFLVFPLMRNFLAPLSEMNPLASFPFPSVLFILKYLFKLSSVFIICLAH